MKIIRKNNIWHQIDLRKRCKSIHQWVWVTATSKNKNHPQTLEIVVALGGGGCFIHILIWGLWNLDLGGLWNFDFFLFLLKKFFGGITLSLSPQKERGKQKKRQCTNFSFSMTACVRIKYVWWVIYIWESQLFNWLLKRFIRNRSKKNNEKR